MLLKELYSRLALGELSQHTLGQSGSIKESDYPKIINHLNTGLTNIYSYFPIREREVVIQQFDHITEYRLNSIHALTNPDLEAEKYIMDSDASPFLDDVLRIEAAYTEIGERIPLNDENQQLSWYTPAWDTIQIPYPDNENASFIMYRAKHPEIPIDADPDTEIFLPPCLEEALQAYIASRCFVALGNAASAGLATYYGSRYDQQIVHVERHNLLQSGDSDSNVKLTQKGFV